MRFSVDRMNALLGRASQTVAWRRASLCPCRDKYSGAATPGCPLCHGKGVLWSLPDAAWTALAGQRATREWAAFGEWKSGDVVLSIPSDSPLYNIGQFDRVRFSDSSQPFSAVLDHTGQEALSFEVQCIDRVFWLAGEPVQVVEGNIPFQDPESLALTWDAGEPPSGTQYTISGRALPEYFFWNEFPTDRAHFHGLDLPRRVVLRLFDLFGK